MERDKIGAILKNRIKECHFTQAEFAEEAGIGLASLKKYISGKVAYDYEVLEKFATVLDCSYEYLLGKSPSPKIEFHTVTEQTHLSEEAIRNINKRAKYYEEEFEARRYIMVLDLMLQEEETLESICDFLIASKIMNDVMKASLQPLQEAINNLYVVKELEIEDSKQISMETQLMIDLIIKMKNLKEKLTPTFISEIKKFDIDWEMVSKLNAKTQNKKRVVKRNDR